MLQNKENHKKKSSLEAGNGSLRPFLLDRWWLIDHLNWHLLFLRGSLSWWTNHCFAAVPFVPGKLAVRCSTRASWLTGLCAEFMAEMARHKISPSGMNCDWLIGDMLIGDTSPAGGGTKHKRVKSWMNSRAPSVRLWRNGQTASRFACRLVGLHPSLSCSVFPLSPPVSQVTKAKQLLRRPQPHEIAWISLQPRRHVTNGEKKGSEERRLRSPRVMKCNPPHKKCLCL